MIVTNLQHTARIESLHPRFKELFDYVRSHDILHMPCGRIEIDGDALFINNDNPECLPAEKQVLEVHRKYIDVQILLEGRETMGWKALDDLTDEVKPYDPQRDCAFYTDRPTSWLHLVPGQLAVFFPEDAHAPIIGEGKIRKMIGKVRID